MNKYILTVLAAGALVFASCSDDNDSNPTVQQPTTFELNEPALSGNLYDLKTSDSIAVTYKQPDYGYTAAVNYVTQISLENTWKDAEGETPANYMQLAGAETSAMYKMSAAAVNKAILELGGYTSEDQIPAESNLYVRMKATLQSGYEVISNPIVLKVKPYYMALTEADPEIWYMIGGCIGDGSWGSGIGTAVFPLSAVDGYDYDDDTGRGELTYTGYFTPDQGFKIVRVPGEWADQWGATDGDITQPRKKDADGEGADFKVPSAGWYKITLNTQTDECKVEATDEPAHTYSHILISGEFNGWAENEEMTPVNTVDLEHNHIWTYTIESDVETKLKFLYDGWSPNWGATGFPYGFGTNNGADIKVPAGKYTIIFNDIDGFYYFIQ